MTVTRPPSAPAPAPGEGSLAPVLCLGEAMAMLSAQPGSGGLRAGAAADIHVGGAEANVAVTLAHLGHRAEWFSRVGDDPFGARILDELAHRGVDTAQVVRDGEHRTGLYLKDWSSRGSRVYYYRDGSAATHLSVADLPSLGLTHRRLCHLSGITPALSAGCDGLVERVLTDPRPAGLTVSFDVNYRPSLWPVDRAAPRLLALARAADVVIVGRDEAETLWRTTTADDVRTLLGEVPVVVVKDDAHGATSYSADGTVFVPSLSVEVVEAIGAGDAFAAGYLAAVLEGGNEAAALRLGHAAAAHTLLHHGDSGVLPGAHELRALAASTDQTWASARVCAAGGGER